MTTTITLNGKKLEIKADPDTPLLWVIRDEVGLSGTKFSCGAGLCGACTVHLEGEPVRSCITPLASAAGKKITTIEGLSLNGEHPVQKAWVALEVAQCGYCQSGQIMAATALLKEHPQPSEAQVSTAMDGNLCRCGTYNRIRAAIHHAAQKA